MKPSEQELDERGALVVRLLRHTFIPAIGAIRPAGHALLLQVGYALHDLQKLLESEDAQLDRAIDYEVLPSSVPEPEQPEKWLKLLIRGGNSKLNAIKKRLAHLRDTGYDREKYPDRTFTFDGKPHLVPGYTICAVTEHCDQCNKTLEARRALLVGLYNEILQAPAKKLARQKEEAARALAVAEANAKRVAALLRGETTLEQATEIRDEAVAAHERAVNSLEATKQYGKPTQESLAKIQTTIETTATARAAAEKLYARSAFIAALAPRKLALQRNVIPAGFSQDDAQIWAKAREIRNRWVAVIDAARTVEDLTAADAIEKEYRQLLDHPPRKVRVEGANDSEQCFTQLEIAGRGGRA